MKKITTLLTLVLTILFSMNASAWSGTIRGNGDVTKETRKVKSFDGVKASAGINVYLFQGDNEKVVVETDENLQECIVTRVVDGVLKCYIDCNNVRNSTKMNVYVNFKNINSIKASSGADIYGETLIVADVLDVNASSSGDIRIEIDANEIDVDVSSGADAVIKGKANYFSGDASSGADIKAMDLVVKEAEASASSGADVRITVTERIKASASSGGDVVYAGNPTIEKVNESSGGDVKRR